MLLSGKKAADMIAKKLQNMVKSKHGSKGLGD